MIFTARIQVELVDDVLEELRGAGYEETAIIHMVCDELEGKITPYYLTEFGKLDFTDCEIKQDKGKEELPF